MLILHNLARFLQDLPRLTCETDSICEENFVIANLKRILLRLNPTKQNNALGLSYTSYICYTFIVRSSEL